MEIPAQPCSQAQASRDHHHPRSRQPHVKLVFSEMRRQNVTYDEMEEKSGVKRPALKAWRHKNYPSLQSLEATLGALGYDFVPVPREIVIPAEVRQALEPIAAQLGLCMPDAVRLTVEIVVDIHSRFADPTETRAAA